MGKIKAMNSQPLTTLGVVRNVPCKSGPWKGKVDFTVPPLDDFNVVLGMEFLDQSKAIPVPTACCVLTIGEIPYMVSTATNALKDKKPLSSLQAVKDVVPTSRPSGQPLF